MAYIMLSLLKKPFFNNMLSTLVLAVSDIAVLSVTMPAQYAGNLAFAKATLPDSVAANRKTINAKGKRMVANVANEKALMILKIKYTPHFIINNFQLRFISILTTF